MGRVSGVDYAQSKRRGVDPAVGKGHEGVLAGGLYNIAGTFFKLFKQDQSQNVLKCHIKIAIQIDKNFFKVFFLQNWHSVMNSTYFKKKNNVFLLITQH